MNRKKLVLVLVCILTSLIFFAFPFEEEAFPRPAAFLRIDIPAPEYEQISLTQMSFKKNKIAHYDKKTNRLIYPQQNAVIHVTYNSLKEKDLKQLLADMERLTFNHTIKADEINSTIYTNFKKRTFGRCYDVSGDAASSVQFYVTDSTTHFFNGSLYFNRQPNYDVDYPLIVYIRKDIDVLLKSLKWNE